MTDLPEVSITEDCNYVAAFLTFACSYRCSYCINSFESETGRYGRMMRGEDWIRGLSRLTNLQKHEGEVPITLQGGEPSMHPDFYEIINALPDRMRIDILTNLSFDIEEMIAKVNPDRLRRESPYASIRVSYHPEQMNLDELLIKTHRMLEAGFHIGIWAVRHPSQEETVVAAQKRAIGEGIDFRLKDFLGYYKGKLYGEYKYPNACSMQSKSKVQCRGTELIIGPGGEVYRCHHDLYENYPPVGHLLDPAFQHTSEFRSCEYYGHCNPCDIKVKTNRLQKFGHTSVEIKLLEPEHSCQTPWAAAATCG